MIYNVGLLKNDKRAGRKHGLHIATRLLSCLLFLFMALQATAADTKQYTVGDVPNVRLTDVRQYVSDPTEILSPIARDSINAILGRLEKSTGIETAVVMLPSIGDADIFDFGHELFRTWGIGKKKSDNGLLILFVMDQRKVRFTTGYGIEGTMTDAMSKRIQMQQMIPHFKEGDWNNGMVDGVRAAAKVLDGSMEPEAADDEDDGLLGALIVLGSIVAITVLCIYLMGEQQRCPKCRKKGGLQKVNSQILRLSTGKNGRRGGRKIRRTTYVCKYCGHTVTKDEDIDDAGNAIANAAILGSALGSGRRGGGFGGGGSFGGSFGGGSTGGGGATSGW